MEINTRYQNKEMTVLPSQNPLVTANPLGSGPAQSASDKVTLSAEAQTLLAADNVSTSGLENPVVTPMSGGAELPPPPPPPPEDPEKEN